MFQGADVDGLDRLTQRTNEAADFADDVVAALRIVVAALRAMSWTGWAAAFANYLQHVVIPWVQTTGRYLRTFASVLALASKEQKEVSGDMPRVSLPQHSFAPSVMPTQSAVVAPRLAAPATQITAGPANGGATGETVVIATPAPLGSVQAPGGGATGAGGAISRPDVLPVTSSPGLGGPATGGVAGVSLPGPTPGTPTPGATGAGWSTGGGAGGSSAVGAGTGGSLGGSALLAGAGAGAGTAGAGAGSSAPVGAGSGRLDPALGTSAGTDGPGPISGGHAPISATPIGLGGPVTGAAGASVDGGSGGLPVVETGAGVGPAMLAVPLGLAGLGAATIGALRSAGSPADDVPDEDPAGGDPTSLPLRTDGGLHRPQDLLPGTPDR